MSQENVELARGFFEQWRAGDYETLIEGADPNVEVYSRFASLGGEPYRGAEGVRRWVAEIKASFDRFDVRTEEFRDLDDRVLVLGSIALEGKASGIEMDQPMGWLLELRNGKLAKMFFFSGHAEALEAAGLSE